MGFELVDDGTMDTVVQCTACGEQLRYTYDPECNAPLASEAAEYRAYLDYVAECIEDANQTHECPKDGDK